MSDFGHECPLYSPRPTVKLHPRCPTHCLGADE
jgi:hypothetical protein